MRILKILLVLFVTGLKSFAADSLVVRSPDSKIALVIYHKGSLHYSILFEGKLVLQRNLIDLELNNGIRLSASPRIKKHHLKVVSEQIISPVPSKRKLIRDQYNQIKIEFREPFSIVFRVYNDGVAYRILTGFKDPIIIKNETAEFNPVERNILLPVVAPRQGVDRFHTSFEEPYLVKNLDSLSKTDLAYTPVLAGNESVRIAITESDLEDYPGMFLSANDNGGLKAVFAPYPLEEKMTDGEFPQLIVTKRSAFIAKRKGKGSLPWRVLIIADNDRELPGNDLVYRLASPSRIKDHQWIDPGRGTDEWIIGINLFNVPFKSGVNTATYKYYIDFAKKFGFDRIMMDAGWSNYKDLFDINPEIDMDTISTYAKAKNIKLSMWTLSSTLDRQLDSALIQFKKWGVDFIMTDFMDRDDQLTVDFYHRIAKATAAHNIMIMFHGAFPPKGFNRTWPHDVTREGVLGSEYNIWSDKATPEHNVTLPFTRMLAGPLDYEPGILNNATRSQFRAIEKQVMTQGTRCHQLAMFVVYDSPMQLFSGNPSQGMQEPEFMKLLGSIPTTWDETIILEAKLGDHIITARQKGHDWYIAGMTDWTSKEFDLVLDFPEEGDYELTACVDGVNADKFPADYSIGTMIVKKGDHFKIKMAPGGGFLLRMLKK